MNTTTNADHTVIDPIEQELILSKEGLLSGFRDVRESLKEIAEANAGLTIDYTTIQGLKEAKSQVTKLKKLNGAIDRTHREIKSDVLAQSKLIDSAKRELKESVAEMIAVHQAPIDEINKREADRQAEIQGRFTTMIEIVNTITPQSDSASIKAAIESFNALLFSEEVFQERYEEAAEFREFSGRKIDEFLQLAKDREAKDAELADLRRKQEERDKADREAKIAADAAEAEREKAELAAKKQREKQEAEKQALIDREQKAIEAKEAAEQAAKAATDKAIADEQARQRRVKSEEEAAERKRLEDLDHVAKVRSDAIVDFYNVCELPSTLIAAKVVEAIEAGEIQNVTIQF